MLIPSHSRAIHLSLLRLAQFALSFSSDYAPSFSLRPSRLEVSYGMRVIMRYAQYQLVVDKICR